MAMFAEPSKDYEGWDYIIGDNNHSLGIKRLHFMESLNSMNNDELVLSFRDTLTNKWTKWKPYHKTDANQIITAYDVHRSMLYNEIVVESDYPTYEENLHASKLIGNLLEDKGFIPHYYFSGNKSVHVCIYLDFNSLTKIDLFLQNQILDTFKYKKMFIRKFMKYLRERIITCWGMKLREFDRNFIEPKHLIRAELSRNKKGYKTFLGYSHKDLKLIPDIFNEHNGFQPRLGVIKLSTPHNVQQIIEDFFDKLEFTAKKRKLAMKEASLIKWTNPELASQIRPCVTKLLECNEMVDGHNRALFVICNDLKRVMADEEILFKINAWNNALGNPLRNIDINYRVYREKCYSISCPKIQEVMGVVGVECDCAGCNMRGMRL